MISEADKNALVKKVRTKVLEGSCVSKTCKLNGDNTQTNVDNNVFETFDLKNKSNCSDKDNGIITLSPSQALVIGGLIGGVLEVQSILVDNDQAVQIVLEGSLKEKSELEILLDQIGEKPFGDVFKAMMDRLG